MIGIDTNVLVRYLTRDDPIQSPRAARLIHDRLTPDDPGFIPIVVLAETVRVLSNSYHFSFDEVAAAIEGLLAAETLLVEQEQQVFAATIAVRERRGSFADALIGELCRAAGCAEIATFDRRALRLPGFVAA